LRGPFACTADNADRICRGADEAGLRVPVLAVSGSDARLLRPQLARPLLAAALSTIAVWAHPVARIVPFDHESPPEAFDQPVRAELISAMAQQRPSVTIRALTEQAVRHFPIYGRAAQGRLQRVVRDAARRAAMAEPERFRYERSTGSTEERVAVLRSLRPSTAGAVPRDTRQYGEAASAAPGAKLGFLARWIFSPNSTKPSVSPPRKRATMGTRATVMHSDDP
jgi:hypothetical protein